MAIEDVAAMKPSLPNGFEQIPSYAHYAGGGQNMMFCDVCEDMGNHVDEVFSYFLDHRAFNNVIISGNSTVSLENNPIESNSPFGYKHHASYKDLQTSAADGCQICCLLVDEVQQQGEESKAIYDRASWTDATMPCPIDYGQISIFSLEYKEGGVIDLFACQDHEGFLARIEVYCDSNDPAAVAKLVRGRPIRSKESIENTLSITNSWIRDCNSNHWFCPSISDVSLPLRVIDVGGLSNEDLFILESHEATGQWVTLSHCWGETVSGCSTTENIAERSRQLLWNELNQNFQDAITITRALGYRYLWIDSLCILQDSHSDWICQSSQMAYIYQNSVLTIAADEAENSSKGFLPKPSVVVTPALQYHSQRMNIQGILHFRQKLSRQAHGPLHRRAWALQESVLSPRTLQFTDEELIWECPTTCKSEGDAKSHSQHDTGGGYLKRLYHHTSDHMKIPDSDDDPEHTIGREEPLDPMFRWYRVVNAYASRYLTNQDDRFPALSGLARATQKRTGFTYKCGIWLEDMHRGLLWWTRERQHLSIIKPAGICAPSWTWTSINFAGNNAVHTMPYFPLAFRVRFPGRDATILQCDVEYADGDPFGRIMSAALTIHGLCRSVDQRGEGELVPIYNDNGDFLTWYTTPNQIFCKTDTESFEQRESQSRESNIYLQIATWGYDRTELELNDEDECSNGSDLKAVFALVLEPTGVFGEYRRRGVARIPEENGIAEIGWELQTLRII